MNRPDDHCEIAFSNVRHGISVDRRFPLNVFMGDRRDFYFFDSDWMRAPDFVDHVQAFLHVERGRCACLWKIDSERPHEPRAFFVRERTTADEYRALLARNAPGYGWLDAMERLGCASDVDEWCMYAEPNNEIAVIGFRHSDAPDRYSSPMSRLHAARIERALEEPLSYGFSGRALSALWRRELLREYSPRSR
jgi:hypothetical protein